MQIKQQSFSTTAGPGLCQLPSAAWSVMTYCYDPPAVPTSILVEGVALVTFNKMKEIRASLLMANVLLSAINRPIYVDRPLVL